MQLIQRTILLVVESLGVGEAPDAIAYGDTGANTLSHVCEHAGKLQLPNLSLMGLGNLTYGRGLERNGETIGFFGKMRQRSDGKSNLAGHWEITGVNTESLFVADPKDYFPEIVDQLRRVTGFDFIMDDSKPGQNRFNRFGEDQMETGSPIIFYENDLTLKIAMHNKSSSQAILAELCKQARELCDRYGVFLIEGELFKGERIGSFQFAGDPIYFPMRPPRGTLLNDFRNMNIPVSYHGFSNDIFSESELDETNLYTSDTQLLDGVVDLLKKNAMADSEQSLIYAVLGDMNKQGQNRDADSYIGALRRLDAYLPQIYRAMNTADLLIITSSHGNDPLFKGKLNTREYLPLLVYSRLLHVRTSGSLGVRRTLSDVAETLSEIYSLGTHYGGESFWSYMISQY